VEQELARIGGEAHGVVTRGQALRAGITVAEIKQRLRTGALIPVHRGVYRVGHRAPSVEARYLAAVRACGESALLSGPAAGHLLGLLNGATPAPEVTARTERRVAGIVTRRSRGIGPRDATIWRGVPVTRPARTLVALAAVLGADHLARACHEAGIHHGTTPSQVEAVLDRHPGSRGAGQLRRILRGEENITLSPLERGFLALLRDAGLALPQTNRPVGGRRVDCHWPQLRLTVELDGYRYHRSRHAWEQDRRRERDARSRGDEFRRYTYGDVFDDPGPMLSELRALLPAHRPAPVSQGDLRPGRPRGRRYGAARDGDG
jgi:very-short-patch-repair endonuclease